MNLYRNERKTVDIGNDPCDDCTHWLDKLKETNNAN